MLARRLNNERDERGRGVEVSATVGRRMLRPEHCRRPTTPAALFYRTVDTPVGCGLYDEVSYLMDGEGDLCSTR